MTESGPPRGRRRQDRDQLGRDDWLDAAAELVAEGGFDNVRILTLAGRLDVSRGSFYWHFRDHHDLIASFLQRWRERRMNELSYWMPGGGEVESETRRILHLLLGEQSRSARRMRIELAVRDFARRDTLAAEAVAAVDEARIRQNHSLLSRIAEDTQGAHDLSLLLYVATMGAQLVMSGPDRDEAMVERIEQLIANLVIQWHEQGGGRILPDDESAGQT